MESSMRNLWHKNNNIHKHESKWSQGLRSWLVEQVNNEADRSEKIKDSSVDQLSSGC